MNTENSAIREDEITLGELINLIKEYILTAFRYWWILLLFALLIGGYNFYKSYNQEEIYTATLTFMLNNGEEGGRSPLTGLMGQIGLPGGMGGSSNFAKMAELMRSRKIILKSLFERVTLEYRNTPKDGGEVQVEEVDDFLANHYIEFFGMRDQWIEDENERMIDFSFKHPNIDSFSRIENSIALSIYRRIISFTTDGDLEGAHLRDNFAESISEIIQLSFKSTSDQYSYEFIYKLFEVLGKYYVEKTVVKQQETLDLVQRRTDSLRQALLNKENQLANYKDSNKGVFKAKSLVRQSDITRDVSFLSSQYSASARSLESARMSLELKTPHIIPIDMPVYPVPKYKPNWKEETFIGIVIGVILGFLLIFVWKFITDALEADRRRTKLREGVA